MKTAIINIKTTQQLKREAQKTAEALGFSLSSVINAYLLKFSTERKIEFSLPEKDLEPSARLDKLVKKSHKLYKSGKIDLPVFENALDAIAFLRKNKLSNPK